MFKKLYMIVLLFSVITLSGCAKTETPIQTKEATEAPTAETTKLSENIRVSALKGPTTMGMVKLMQDSEDSKTTNKYEFTIATVDEIVPKIAKGEIDIAAIPANLASVLYNNTKGGVQVLAINTLGVLYIVEKGDTIQTIQDLKGKTIYATGKGTTPEYVINYLLSANGITDVNIEYKAEASEILPLLVKDSIALLPQPFATTAISKFPELRVALDLTKEWDSISKDGSSLVTGVVVVRREFLEKNEESVKSFLKEYSDSTNYSKTNIKETSALIEKYGIVSKEVAEIALPLSNITYIEGEQMKEKLTGYLNVLFNQNPQSIGGSLPSEDFYYIEK